MVLAENLEKDDEVVLFKAGINKSKRDIEIQDEEEGQRKRGKWEDKA